MGVDFSMLSWYRKKFLLARLYEHTLSTLEGHLIKIRFHILDPITLGTRLETGGKVEHSHGKFATLA
jgi:hypothetical protein